MPEFTQQTWLVVGDAFLLRYCLAHVHKISPEAPVPVARITQETSHLGGAARVAQHIQSLGGQARLLAPRADDAAGHKLAHDAETHGIQTQWLPASATPVHMQIMCHDQVILHGERQAPGAVPPVDLDAWDLALEGVQGVIVCDHASDGLTLSPQVTARLTSQPLFVLAPPHALTRYPGATWVCSTDGLCPPAHTIEAATAWCQRAGWQALCWHEPPCGLSMVLPSAESPFHRHTTERTDSLGIPEGLIATLAMGWMSGLPAHTTARLAYAAMHAIGSDSAPHVLTPQDLILHDPTHPLETGLHLHLDEVPHWLAQQRAGGRRVVMTNGCFDILHAGHVHYLHAAKQLGDVLIVAVNSDASVRQLKGSSRPVHPLSHRLHLLQCLEPVDAVIAFDDLTPVELIQRIQPEILVKGGDYTLQEVVGADIVRSYGGEVQVIPTPHPHLSSSRMLPS